MEDRSDPFLKPPATARYFAHSCRPIGANRGYGATVTGATVTGPQLQ